MNKKDTQPVAVSDDEFDNDANDPNDSNDPKHWRDQRIITWDRRVSLKLSIFKATSAISI